MVFVGSPGPLKSLSLGQLERHQSVRIFILSQVNHKELQSLFEFFTRVFNTYDVIPDTKTWPL